MNLNLKNPIIFFDLETTGLDVCKDRIVQIAYIKVNPNGTEEEKNFLINPERPIPAETTAIHGISDADVADKPTFKELASVLVKDFKGSDIAGFNSNRFDIPLLAEEFLRAGADIDLSRCKKIDVQTIFHKKEQRTLTAAYKLYCGKDLDNAHNALADTRATYEVLKGQLDKYPDLENDMAYLSEFTSHNKNVDFDRQKNEASYNLCNQAIDMYSEEMTRVVLVPTWDESGKYYMGRTKVGIDELSVMATTFSDNVASNEKEIMDNNLIIDKMQSAASDEEII